MMIEHTYFICKSSWCINIKVIAEISNYDNLVELNNVKKVTDGIWIMFAKKPLGIDEVFYEGDLVYLIKGLQIVQKQIINNSPYTNTLIVIHSLQFSLCDFQEEGLIAAMIEWASIGFGFEKPLIHVDFQKENNKYVFSFL